MKVHEIKRLVASIPQDRDGEDISLWHPFYRRLFQIEAVDDLNIIDPSMPRRLVFVTSESPNGG